MFLEHGLAPDPSVQRWQRRIDPLSTRLLGNCHMSREVSGTFEHAGFETRCMGSDYVPHVPRYAGWVEWGVAGACHIRKNPLGRMGIISVDVNHAHPRAQVLDLPLGDRSDIRPHVASHGLDIRRLTRPATGSP